MSRPLHSALFFSCGCSSAPSSRLELVTQSLGLSRTDFWQTVYLRRFLFNDQRIKERAELEGIETAIHVDKTQADAMDATLIPPHPPSKKKAAQLMFPGKTH